MINNNESIPDYLFRVNGIKLDCGFIQSSLMIFTRELAIKVPFDISLKYHQDIDWLLRLSNSKIKFSYIQSPNHTVRYMSTPFSVSKKYPVRIPFLGQNVVSRTHVCLAILC